MSKRTLNKSLIRGKILMACGELFRAQGFDETTIPDIMKAAAISRQTFFNYFSGKEAVLTELGLAWLQQQAEVPRLNSNPPESGSYLAGTREAIRLQLQAIKADPEFMRLVFMRSGLLFSHHTELVSAGSGRGYHEYTRPIFDGIAVIMSEAQKAGEIREDIPPVQIAEMYVSQMLMTIRFWLVDYWSDGIDLEDRAMKALDVLEAGLRAGAKKNDV